MDLLERNLIHSHLHERVDCRREIRDGKSYFVVIMNLDEVKQHLLESAVLMDTRSSVVHQLESMLAFVVQQRPEYN